MPFRIPLVPQWLRWSGVLATAALIFYLSIVTVPPAEPIVPGRPDLLPLDKWRHFLAYAALGGSLAYATADWQTPRPLLAGFVVGTTICYGVGIEVGQSFLPARYFSVADAWANAFGALLVLPWFAIRPYLTLTPVSSWLAGLRSGS